MEGQNGLNRSLLEHCHTALALKQERVMTERVHGRTKRLEPLPFWYIVMLLIALKRERVMIERVHRRTNGAARW